MPTPRSLMHGYCATGEACMPNNETRILSAVPVKVGAQSEYLEVIG